MSIGDCHGQKIDGLAIETCEDNHVRLSVTSQGLEAAAAFAHSERNHQHGDASVPSRVLAVIRKAREADIAYWARLGMLKRESAR